MEKVQDIKEEKLQTKEKRPFNLAFRSFGKNLAFGILLSLFIALIIMAFTCPNCWTDSDFAFRHILISCMYGMGLYLSMSHLNSYLSPRMSWLENPWRAFFIVLGLNTMTVLAVTSVVSMTWRGVLLGMSPIESITNQGFSEYFIPLIIGLFITSVFVGASFLNTWKTSLLQAEKFKQAQLDAKYEALTSQVNPHFLFNSLNVLSALVKKDPDKAEDFIQQLAQVYRNILEFRKEELITVKKEVETLSAYIFLIQTRFANRIHLNNSLVPKEDQYIVPLSLQMLLENAVKHNSATSTNPLKIDIYADDEKIWVVNNRQALNEKVMGKKMGLENISERYRLATNQEIVVEDGKDYFKVGLPIISD